MIEPLETTIERIPSDTGLGSGSSVLVVPAGEGESTARLYRRFIMAPAICRAPERVVAIVSTGVLNSPDQVGATGRRGEGNSFETDLEIRRFEGSMRANDPWIALVRMELGSLEPGSYQLMVKETVLHFRDRLRPECAIDPSTSKRRVSFDCV